MAREDSTTGAVSFRLDKEPGNYRSSKRAVSIEKYPAKQHAQRVAEKLGVDKGLIYLPGSPITYPEDSDQPIPFRQRRYFYYITGVNESDCHATYDIAKDSLILYITPPDLRDVIYNGHGSTVEDALEHYDIDDCSHVSRLPNYLQAWSIMNPGQIYLLHESQKPEADIEGSRYDTKSLQDAMDLARVIKDFHEIELIRKANKITAAAHRQILKEISSFKNEREVAGAFIDTCISKGAPNQAYEIIAASGQNASTLHYIKNDEPLEGRQLMCLDAGCEYECYASDVTRTFPLSGSWPSKEAKEIYDLVQKMQDACVTRMGPGVKYLDLHITAHKTAIEGLLDLGILHNGSVDEILSVGTSQAFYPHGLGHHVGLEVHDVLYRELLQPVRDPDDYRAERENKTMTSFWRPSRGTDLAQMVADAASPYGAILEENMVLTVEPGIYFSRFALDKVYLPNPLHSKYINQAVLERYLPVGGVRIEDDYLITAKGNENLTLAPKGEDMLRIIRGEAVPSHDDNTYGPIRGRPGQHTFVDTKDIKRQLKRRLESLQYTDRQHQMMTADLLWTGSDEPCRNLLRQNEAETIDLTSTDFFQASPTLSTSSIARNSGSPVSDPTPSEVIESATRKRQKISLASQTPTTTPWSQHHASHGPLIALEESQHVPPTQNSVVENSVSSQELEWHDQPTLFHNFTAPNVQANAPDVPEKPLPYRPRKGKMECRMPALSKMRHTGSPSRHSWNDQHTQESVEVVHSDVPTDSVSPHEEASASIRRHGYMSHSPVSPIHLKSDAVNLMQMPGSFPTAESPPVSPVESRIPLRNRQSMPVFSNAAAMPTRSFTQRLQRPRGRVEEPTSAIRPSASTLDLQGTHRDTNPFRLHETVPMLTLGSPLRESGLCSRRSIPRPHNFALPPPPPPPRYPRIPRPRATHLDSSSRFSLPSIQLPAPRAVTQSDERPPLEPWWLVQAAGELRRKHPRTTFNLKWSTRDQCWMVSCTSGCYALGIGEYRVGPGQTLDEFENHLWMKHEQERQTQQDQHGSWL